MKKSTASFLAFLYGSSALGATLMPNGEQQFIDANGKPYANGKVFFYSNYPTCTILKNTYQDAGGTILNTNPVVLSAAGRATIFGTGAYCQVLKDASNNTIWTKYTSDTSSASNLGWGGTGGGTANAQTVTVNGFTSLNGQTFYFLPSVTNTGPMTLAVNGGSAVAVVKETTAGPVFLTGGEVVNGTVVGMTYVSATGQFHLVTNNNTLTGFVGEVRAFAVSSCPAGWLATDGSAQSATTYPDLFLALGTTWGTSAGNVVLPDFRGMFLRGTGTNGTYPTAIGGAVGVAGYQADVYLNHLHSVPDHNHTTYGVTTSFFTGSAGAIARLESLNTAGANITGTTSTVTGVNTGTSTTGGTETRPKNYGVQYCIKY